MKKLLGYKFFVAAMLAAGFASCENYDEGEDDTFNTRLDKPVVTLSASSFTVTEGEDVEITLTSDKAITTPMEFKLEMLPGSTGGFRDFVAMGDETTITTGAGVIGYLITMPAYTTSYTFTISPEVDLFVEGTETFNFRLYGASNSAGNIAEGAENIMVTVNDFVSNDVGLKLVWDGNAPDAFGTIVDGEYLDADGDAHAIDDFDFDLYVINTVTFEDVTEYAGATGNSPEEVVISADAPDGEYYIIADLYDVGTAPAADFTFDMTLYASKFGVWDAQLPIDDFMTNHPTSAPSGLGDGLIIVAILTKTGTTYTLTDAETEELLASGRMAQLKNVVRGKGAVKL